MSTNYEDRQRGGGYDSDDDGDRRPMGGAAAVAGVCTGDAFVVSVSTK